MPGDYCFHINEQTGMGGDYSQDSYLKDMEYNLNVLKKIGK